MPYIDRMEREALDDEHVGTVFTGMIPGTAGRLAYALYRICLNYLGRKPRFLDFAIVFGVLLCVILELYRRKAAPYEDFKVLEQGDVT